MLNECKEETIRMRQDNRGQVRTAMDTFRTDLSTVPSPWGGHLVGRRKAIDTVPSSLEDRLYMMCRNTYSQRKGGARNTVFEGTGVEVRWRGTTLKRG